MIDRRFVLGGTVLLVLAAGGAALLTGGFEAAWGFPGAPAVWALAFAVTGYVIDRSEPGHPVGRKLLWVGPLAAVSQLSIELTLAGSATFLEPLTGLFFIFLSLLLHALAVFPDGEWVAPWARPSVIAMWVFGFGGFLISAILGTTPVGGLDDSSALLDGLLIVWNVSTLGVAVGVIWGFVKAEGLVRKQFSWLAFATVVTAGFAMASAVTGSEVASALAAIGVVGIPVAVAIAVTRYRLYEIDRIVSRTVAYAATVVVLAGLYAVVVIGSRSVLGVEGEWPVALWTLAAAFALFPLARRVQGWVDRRFFRSRYDSASVVGAFADELRVTVDPESLVERTESVVGQTFQAETVAVWLAEERA